ncbi:MAG: hypothetical protein ACRDZ3_09705 [Acidimicrobiia bacterium]
MNLRRIGAVVVVSGLVVAACGKAAEVVAPEIAVRNAAHSTFDGQKGTFALSLVGDQADLATLLQPPGAGGVPKSNDDDQQFLDALAGSKISVSLDGGDQATADDDRFALSVDIGDVERAVELRVVDKVLYLRGDVAGLARLFKADTAALSGMVDGAAQNGFGFVADAIAGKWLSLDLSPLENLGEGAAQPGAPMPNLDTAQFSNLLDAVSETFGTDVDVKRVGEEDPGVHYRLTVPVRRVYERLVPTLGQLFTMPGMETLPPATEIPDRTITLDVWTDDDRINRAELDLGQFAPEPPAGRVALRVDIDRLDGDVKAPGAAVAVDFAQIFSQLMAGFGATIGS